MIDVYEIRDGKLYDGDIDLRHDLGMFYTGDAESIAWLFEED